MSGPGLAAGSMGACGANPGTTAEARGGRLNGEACRRAQPALHCSHGSLTLASGWPPASPHRHGGEHNNPGTSPGRDSAEA